MPDPHSPDRWERDLLIQLGEQFKGLRHDTNRHAEVDEEEFRKIDANFQTLRTAMETREARLEAKFVTKTEFSPTRMIAYGLVALIVMSVVTALISIVVGAKIHTP